MGDRTGIEWSDASWNPTVGCQYASDGCTRCYAAREAAGRLSTHPLYVDLAVKHTNDGGPARFTGEVRVVPERLDQPLRWRRPRRIFVDSMSDLFHPSVPLPFLTKVFAVMASAPQHTFQVLTKRPHRMAEVVGHPLFMDAVRALTHTVAPSGLQGIVWPLPNVWLGTSVESQEWADRRIPHLLATPAAVRWVSAEPLLGPVDLILAGGITYHHGRAGHRDFDGYWHDEEPEWTEGAIDWLVAGGESGPGARPMHPDWPRLLRDQCRAAGVPYLFKQWGEWRAVAVVDAPEMAGGRAFQHPDGGRQSATIRRTSSKAFTSGRTELMQPGDENRGGVRMLDLDTVAVRVGKRAAGRELDGRLWDEYPEQVSL